MCLKVKIFLAAATTQKSVESPEKGAGPSHPSRSRRAHQAGALLGMQCPYAEEHEVSFLPIPKPRGSVSPVQPTNTLNLKTTEAVHITRHTAVPEKQRGDECAIFTDCRNILFAK